MFSFQNNLFNFGLFNSGKTQDVEDLSKFIHSEKHMQMRSTFWEYQDKFPEIDTLVQALAEKVFETSTLTKQEFNKCKKCSWKHRINMTVSKIQLLSTWLRSCIVLIRLARMPTTISLILCGLKIPGLIPEF